MTKILNGDDLSTLLTETITHDRRVRMAVAFWGAGAMKHLRLKNHPAAQLICNLMSGGTNPHEVKKLIESGIKVRAHSRLHAKIGIIGDQFSFVGSSNVSANGLGFEGNDAAGWEEANVVFDGIEERVLARFDALWRASVEITQVDLDRAKITWESRQKTNARVNLSGTLIDAITNSPDLLDRAEVNVAIYHRLNPDEQQIVEIANQQVIQNYGEEFCVYWDWPELPIDGLLLDYERPPQGPIAFTGIYRRQPEFQDFTNDGENYQVAYTVKDVFGLTVSKQDKERLRRAVMTYIRSHDADEDGAHLFPVSALRRILLQDA